MTHKFASRTTIELHPGSLDIPTIFSLTPPEQSANPTSYLCHSFYFLLAAQIVVLFDVSVNELVPDCLYFLAEVVA